MLNEDLRNRRIVEAGKIVAEATKLRLLVDGVFVDAEELIGLDLTVKPAVSKDDINRQLNDIAREQREKSTALAELQNEKTRLEYLMKGANKKAGTP